MPPYKPNTSNRDGTGKSERLLKEMLPIILLKHYGHSLPFDYALGFFLDALPFLYKNHEPMKNENDRFKLELIGS
jgi:hypothetical protein